VNDTVSKDRAALNFLLNFAFMVICGLSVYLLCRYLSIDDFTTGAAVGVCMMSVWDRLEFKVW